MPIVRRLTEFAQPGYTLEPAPASSTFKYIVIAALLLALGVFGYLYVTKNAASPAVPEKTAPKKTALNALLSEQEKKTETNTDKKTPESDKDKNLNLTRTALDSFQTYARLDATWPGNEFTPEWYTKENYGFATLESCAKRCNDTAGCDVFGWNPNEKFSDGTSGYCLMRKKRPTMPLAKWADSGVTGVRKTLAATVSVT